MENLCLDDVYGEVTVTVQAVNGCKLIQFAFDCFMSKELKTEDKYEYAYDVAHALTNLAGYNSPAVLGIEKKDKKNG